MQHDEKKLQFFLAYLIFFVYNNSIIIVRRGDPPQKIEGVKIMKKVLAIVLSLMMLIGVFAPAASAAVAYDDTAINYLLNGEYTHLDYVAKKDNFKTELGWYTAMGLYKDAWKDYVSGKTGVSEAETILLALIEKIDAEYENEVFEKVISALEGVKKVSELAGKVDGVINVLGLKDNEQWSQYLGTLGTIIEVANYGNEMYETFVEGYAAILSAQAASEYYGDFLDMLIADCDNSAVKQAAESIKENIGLSYEDSVKKLLAEIADQAAADGVTYGVEIAMDAWTVTAAIKTGYKTVKNLANKIFNTTDKYKYMRSLVILKDIEAVTPAYVSDVIANGATDAADFAINVILTLRETGESMANGLGKVVEDDQVNKLLKYANYTEIKEGSSIGMAKLALIRDVISAETLYTTYEPIAVISTRKDVAIYKDGEIAASLAAGKAVDATYADGFAYAVIYNGVLGGTVAVVIPTAEGITVEETAAAAPATENSGSTSKSSGNFFQRLIQAIKDIFAKLFSFGKK